MNVAVPLVHNLIQVLLKTGRDHIVISEPQSGKRYLLLMIYLDYVEFPEEITYLPSQQATYTPRP